MATASVLRHVAGKLFGVWETALKYAAINVDG
jgi:hypothetical protein